MTKLSEKATTILNFLKENYGKGYIYTEIADATGIAKKSVIGVLNGLVKKELVGKEDMTVETDDGKEKVLKSYSATEKGLNFEEVEEEEEA